MDSSDLKAVIGDQVRTLNKLADEPAKTRAHRGVSMTEYVITGSLPAVFKAIEFVFGEYPGLAYGTCVHQLEQLSDGTYGARMSRSHNAD